MTRHILIVVTVLVFACLAPPDADAASAPVPPWWNKAWRYRKTVRVNIPAHGNDIPVTFFESSLLVGERSLTGRAVINIESGTERLSDEIVVTDAAGNVLPSRVFSRGWDNQATVLFRAAPSSAVYYVYYGNPKAKRGRVDWQRSAFPIAVATVRVPDAGASETPARAARALLAAKQVVDKTETYAVWYTENPFGLRGTDHYLTLYSGLMAAPVDGTYELAVDAGGTAHLLIDGSLVLTAKGAARPAKVWKNRAQVRLKRGVHNFTVLHGERGGAQGIRVGWIRPGERRFSVMSGEAFARGNYVDAEAASLEVIDKPLVAFFTLARSDVAFRVRGGRKGMVALELRNHTRGDGLTFTWQVGAKKLTGRSPRCFVEADGRSKVTLNVSRDGKKIGSYERSVNLSGVRHVDAAARFEMLRCPNVVYEAEGAKFAFKVVNPSKHPIPVRFQRVVGKDESTFQDFEIAAGDERSVDVTLPVLPKGTASAGVTFRLWLVETVLGEERVSLIRPGPALAALTPKLGHLVDGKGRRTVIVTDLENEDEHRRWAAVKWVAKKLKSKPKDVLLFGDRMLDGEGARAGGYVDLIRRRLGEDDRVLTFVERKTSAIVPCVADIPAFAAALKKHTPGLIVISAGSRDALRGVERVQFARSLDVMIDLARSHKSRPAVVLVSPPPLVSHPNVSAEHASAVRIIARQHRAPFVDLHALITAKSGWQDLYKHEVDDRVFHLHPSTRAHRIIADAILKVIE